jgi:hypothetical protein
LYWAAWNRAGCPGNKRRCIHTCGDRLDCPCSSLTPSPISLFPLNVLWLTAFTVSLTRTHTRRCAGSQLFLWFKNVTVGGSLMSMIHHCQLLQN